MVFMARQAKKLILMSLVFLDGFIRRSRMRFKQVLPPRESADYEAWRLQFLWRRLGLCLWVALACIFTATLLDLYRVFYQEQAENFPQELNFLEVIEDVTGVVLLLIWLIFHKTKWGIAIQPCFACAYLGLVHLCHKSLRRSAVLPY